MLQSKSSNGVANWLNSLYLCFYFWCEAILRFFLPSKYYSKDLNQEIVLITGAASGIGRQLALALASQVRHLVLWDINQHALRETHALVRERSSVKCTFFTVDITDRHNVYRVAQQVRKDVGTVTVVVNNAGVVSGKAFLSLSDEEILRSFNVNVISNFWINKAFLPDMMAQNHGHIVTMATVASFFGVPKLTDYSASKAAVYMLHETMACEMMAAGLEGVKFTAICPFLVNTGMFNGAGSSLLRTLNSEEVVNKIVQAIKTDQFIAAIPRIVYFFMWIKQMIPAIAGYHLLKLTGFLDLMANFNGRLNGKIENQRTSSPSK